ncbi:MAG TPA: hypothetical protein VII93_07870 [Anaerolineales bacterium]
MVDRKPPDSPTVLKHKHQFTWQILVPFLVMAGLIITGAVFAVTGGPKQARVWADVSIIWMLAPMLGFALLITVVLGSLIYGMAKLTQIAPHYTGRAQEFAVTVSAGTHKVADGAAKPIFWFQQAGATIKSLFQK